jgi:predicted nucleic acid-binding protein
VKYLVDANVLSEMTKQRPEPSVLVWLQEHEQDLATSPIVLGELEFGILLLPAGRRRTRLRHWYAGSVKHIRVLDFDSGVAAEWAQLLARLRKSGQSMPVKDSLIAATAIAHALTVVTRNVRDFQHAGVKIVNPFPALN